MPRQVNARVAQDPQEELKVRKLAASHHAPADWKFHAQMVLLSWAEKTPNEIATELGCHPQTGRIHLKGVQCSGNRRTRHAARIRAQVRINGAGKQSDPCSGQAGAARAS